MTECDVDTELFITKIQQMRAIWDKNSDDYKDRIKTAGAWREICREFRNNYDELPEKDQKKFCKYNYNKEVITLDNMSSNGCYFII